MTNVAPETIDQPRTVRRRDADATRQAILQAAKLHFAKSGYEGAFLRDIAVEAGVDAAMINRYFGSKEGLFAEVLKRSIRSDRLSLFDGDRSKVGHELAQDFATQSAHHNEDRLHAFQFLLRAATSPTTAPMLNDAVQQRFMGPIREWLGGEDAPARARLISAFFIGLLVERLIRDEPLPHDERQPFIERLAPILQALVDKSLEINQQNISAENTMTDGNITKDTMYDAVAPDDFESMIELDRYEKRSTAFDKIISATHDHFWDPLDKKYIDFSEPFDLTKEALMPDDQIFAVQIPYVRDHLEKTGQKVKFVNEMTLWSFSSILHGEQGALNLSASLCHVLKDQGAQEYAANQTREEARHVTAFAQYIKARWGRPRPCGDALKKLLIEIIHAPEVYKKIIGMQMLVEGLAMGAFAAGYKFNRDPLARKLFQLVMTDEAFHHKFGKIWADRTVPKMTEEERNTVEDWAAHCFQSLLFNLGSPQQQAAMYHEFGLDPEKVMQGLIELRSDARVRERMKESTNIFRVLIKTLIKAGLVTERTRAFYATYVDMEELFAEGDRMVGDDIAEDGIKYLQEINFKDRSKAPIAIAAE